MNSKGFAFVIHIIVLAIIFSAGAGVAVYTRLSSEKAPLSSNNIADKFGESSAMSISSNEPEDIFSNSTDADRNSRNRDSHD